MVEAILAASLVLATLLNLGAWHAGLSMPAEVYLGLAVALAGTAWVQGTAGRLALCVAAVMVAVILGSPLTSWDARVIWFFHGKRIFLGNDILAQLDNYIPATHNDYPVLIPAVAASLAKSVGYWNEVFPRLSILTIVLPALVFIAIRIERTNHVLAWLTCVLVLGNKLLINGFMDSLLALTVASLGVAYMELHAGGRIRSTGERWGLVFLVLVLTVALPHLKNEGMLAVIAFGVSMGVRSRQWRVPLLATLLATFGYIAGWRVPVALNAVQTDLFVPGMVARAATRLTDPGAVLLIGAWFALHAGPACVTLVAHARTRQAGMPIDQSWMRAIAFVGFCVLGMAAIYLTTPNDLAWHLETSARRVFLPVLIYAVTVVMYDLSNAGKNALPTGM